MRKTILGTGLLVAMALAAPAIVWADPLQSGPQVGTRVPGAFSPLNINGPSAGQKCCQYCKNGSRPVVVVFARDVTPALVGLLKKIDDATGANREQGLGSYVVFCSDAEGLGQQLQAVAQKEGLQNTILTLYKAGGPEKYRLSPDADVTVLLYRHFTVKANHALKNSDLTDAASNAIVADLDKILTDN